MRVEGDGESQPTEGVTTLTDLTAALDGGEEGGEDAPEESEDSDAPDESEGEEVEQEGEEEAEEDQEEPTVTLKHDGKEFTLKQSEVVELAQKGYDYTQKTMVLADERKVIESERTHVTQLKQRNEQALNQNLGRLQALESFLSETIGAPPPVDLAQRDVALYIAQKEQYEARKGQLAEAQDAVARLQDEQARSRQAWIAEKSAAAEATLRGTLPGWNDTTITDLNAYIGKHGLGWEAPEDVMLESGFWEMAHKAKAYDELQAQKSQMKPVSKLPKVAPPSSKNQPPQLARRQEAHKRYTAKPSVSTLADLL